MKQTVHEIQIKNEDGTWSTSKMFGIGDSEEKDLYVQELIKNGYEVSENINQIKTKEQLIADLIKLVEESSKTSFLIGENVILNALTSVQ